jgi:hypothetical protein
VDGAFSAAPDWRSLVVAVDPKMAESWDNGGRESSGARDRRPARGSCLADSANVYLHSVFDLWVHHWRRRNARGDDFVIRYADALLEPFKNRLLGFGLALHPDKKRLLEFGRYAQERFAKAGKKVNPRRLTFWVLPTIAAAQGRTAGLKLSGKL